MSFTKNNKMLSDIAMPSDLFNQEMYFCKTEIETCMIEVNNIYIVY